MDVAVDVGAVTMRVVRAAEGAAEGAAETEVLPVSAGPLPWLGVDAAQRSVAGWDQPSTPARVLADLLKPVVAHADAGDPLSSFTLAAPDAWWGGTVAGAVARETARGVLRGDLGLPPVRFVPRTVAAAAWLAATGEMRSGRLLVCDVGAHAVSVAVVAVRPEALTVLAAQSSGGPGERPAAAQFEQALALAAARAHGGGQPAGRDVSQAVRQALRESRRRAAAVLPRARVDARYADTPVYELPLDPPVSVPARDVTAAFGPVAQTLRAVLGQLALRKPFPAARDDVLLTGGLGNFPETAATVSDVLGAAGAGPPIRSREANVDAVARGAWLVGTAAVRFAELAGEIRLPVRRVRRGRLYRESLVLPQDGSGATVPGSVAPAQVEVGDERRVIEVEARSGQDGTRCAVTGDPPPAGRYEVGLWPTFSGAVLALRPASGGEPVMAVVPGLAAARVEEETA